MICLLEYVLMFFVIYVKYIGSASYYSPCNYPGTIHEKSDNFFSACSMDYLGSKIFCDPNSMFTRTDADYIIKLLKRANFSTCFCTEFARRRSKALEKCSQFNIEIIFVRYGTLMNHDETKFCGIQRIKNLYHLKLQSQLIQFAKLVQQNWLIERDCSTDLFLAAIQSWIGRDSEVFYLVPILSDKLISALKHYSDELTLVETFRSNTTNIIFEVRHYVERIYDALDKLKIVRDALIKAHDSSKVPIWAIIVVSFCIISVPLCILIGNLVAFTSPFKSTSPDHVTIRMANQRFGGKNDKGGKPAKGQSSNIMMFRHFHKKDVSSGPTIKYV